MNILINDIALNALTKWLVCLFRNELANKLPCHGIGAGNSNQMMLTFVLNGHEFLFDRENETKREKKVKFRVDEEQFEEHVIS